MVVIDALIAETGRRSAYWKPATEKFYGRDIWETTAQDFIAHVQATGQFSDHRAAQHAGRQWRESLAAAEKAQLALNRIAILQESRNGVAQALQAATDQTLGQHPDGWQQQIAKARISADELIAELPDFLLKQVANQPQIDGLTDPLQYLMAMHLHIEELLTGLPPLPIHGGLDSEFTKGPMNKEELEVLVLFVEAQIHQTGNPFATERRALLRNESIRHLKELSLKLEAIRTTTATSQQQLANHSAQQAALAAELERQVFAQRELEEQQAREEAEAAAAAAAELEQRLQEQARQDAQNAANARLEAWRATAGALVVDVPQLHGQAPSLVAAGTALTLLDTAALSLTAAVRAAIAALSAAASGVAASAGVLLSGLAVGFVALLWPSSLAPSDRRSALLMPLNTLPAPDDAALDAAVQSGEAVTLPYAATLRSRADGLQIHVVAGSNASPLRAQVIDLVLNLDTGAYQALIDTPPGSSTSHR